MSLINLEDIDRPRKKKKKYSKGDIVKFADRYKPPKLNNVIWDPNPGAQMFFLACPTWEVLLWGNRGGGKTDVLLMDYLQHVDTGFGADWRGILFREAYTELTDIIAKSKKWIPRMFPKAKYNSSEHKWTFEAGEELYLRYIRTEDDYWQYHGHEYPWIGWEELTNWPFSDVYLKMMSCNRSSNKYIPRKYRSTCNTNGPGHQWVKERFIIPCIDKPYFTDEFGQTRTHIKSKLDENKVLLNSDPLYKQKILSMTEGNDMLRKAWVYGSWNLVIGGFFSDVWAPKKHIIREPFLLNPGWDVYRSFDWGSSKPWCVTYFAVCNGETAPGGQWFPRNTILVITEIYGWNGKVNEGDQATSQQIAERVKTMDKMIKLVHKTNVYPGPADTSIWEVKDGKSIAQNMKKFGLKWKRAYKGPGSRIAGWSIIRTMLYSAKVGDRENPGLYFFSAAKHHIRTLPLMQRDKKKPEDIDTEMEDHAMDSLRYGVARKLSSIKRGKIN